MADSQTRALARRLAALERQALQRKQPSLAYSSVDDGALVATVDGTVTVVVGAQHDGTNAAVPVVGPPPPQPQVPLVTPMPGGLRVYWDGTYSDGSVSPMDFARVLVYAVPSSVYTVSDPLNQTYVIGQLTSALGGEITAGLAIEEHHVYLVAWSQAGKYSVASDIALGSPTAVLDQTALDAGLATKSSIYRQEDAPWPDGDTTHDSDAGDMWLNTSMGPGPILDVETKAITANVVTLTTSEEHDMVAGNTVAVGGVDPGIDGSYEITATTDRSLSFTLVASNMLETVVTGGTVQGLDVEPLNTPFIWDATPGEQKWLAVQDSGAQAALTLQDDVKSTQIDLKRLSVTATDAYSTAYAADGRVAISDYEPGPNDVYQLDSSGNPVLDDSGRPTPKNNGSLWITRTRDRANLCVNPSFETSTAFWSTSGASMARVAMNADPDTGSWAARITNDATTGAAHTASLTAAVQVAPAEEMILSGYMRSVSGAVDGYYAYIGWYDASNTLIGTSIGQAISLAVADPTTEAWARAYVADVAPAGTDHAIFGFASPAAAASAVWELDGVLVELSDRLGRYFDGNSDGGSWDATVSLSSSTLDGGAIIRLFNLEDGSWAEKFWTGDTISSVNVDTLRPGPANRQYQRPAALPAGTFDGALTADNSLAVDKLYAPPVTCSQAIPAGSLVNVYDASGTPMIRLAKATDPDYAAHGFVTVDGAVGQAIPVHSEGYNPLLSGLLGGAYYLSTTPGKVTKVPSSSQGYIVQRVGTAMNSTTLNFTVSRPISIS